jgi:phosphoribosylformylglycinamidine synthase subunit PurQ / glutaminase
LENTFGGCKMRPEEIRILIMRAPGTNCDLETERALRDLGPEVHNRHTQKVFKDKNLEEYDVLVFPGGFSYGDYVRSGAIWAKECEYRIGSELIDFVDSGKPVIGICNGFQLLVELGFLPGWNGKSLYPEAALGNSTHGYQNRWIRIKYEGQGNCKMLNGINSGYILSCPVAHGEGRFLLPPENREKLLDKLYQRDMIMWRYVNADGSYAEYNWPANPNGAFHDIAGICNPDGTVLGLMPHPERAYFGYLMPEWTKKGEPEKYGSGYPFFKSIIDYVAKKF